MTATVAKRVIWVLMALMASAAQPACGAEPGAPLIVADSLSHEPLAYASVFDRDGHFLGTTTTDGMVKCAVAADYPLTIRHMGFHEQRIEHPVRRPDTLFMVENIPELPEVEVMAARKRVLLPQPLLPTMPVQPSGKVALTPSSTVVLAPGYE